MVWNGKESTTWIGHESGIVVDKGVIVKKSSPHPNVGCLSADRPPTDDRQVTDSFPIHTFYCNRTEKAGVNRHRKQYQRLVDKHCISS